MENIRVENFARFYVFYVFYIDSSISISDFKQWHKYYYIKKTNYKILLKILLTELFVYSLSTGILIFFLSAPLHSLIYLHSEFKFSRYFKVFPPNVEVSINYHRKFHLKKYINIFFKNKYLNSPSSNTTK